ncbi:MAG TPA: biosynthetic arginine decarboxylase [Thermoanaerobaculia bacterium]|nr:biosynthetic arginine decarboxylase [Thermoanaerobaculia bacterium]
MTVDEQVVDELTEPEVWSVERAAELYNVAGWSNDYFSINERGHVAVHPGGPGSHAIDLKELVDEVVERGIAPPLLFRFSEIIEARVVELNEAFQAAIAEYGYRGSYRGVYPIKVNQDRYLVERLVGYGRPYHFGLEAGSKPELLAVMAMVEDPEALIVCNGYKDSEYVETALLASKLGRRVVLVVEKFSELPLIAEVSRRTGVAPMIGARARLATRGAGHWEGSGGDRSKFGLSSSDLVAAVKFLRERGLLDRFQLLHFHLGSQISSIRSIKEGVREAAWTYVNLVEMGAGLRYLDVGGGLGVDYQGNQSDVVSSVNYTLQEYVNDVVYGAQEVCDQRGVDHPILVTESGRATVAHHAALVIDVLGVAEFSVGTVPERLPEAAGTTLANLFEAYREAREDNLLEVYHDAVTARDDARTLFKHGHVSLEQRGLAEELFWAVGRKVWDLAQRMDEPPEELRDLAGRLADTYFCNFSVFQSVPDFWAIDQLFPVLPIHRLEEEPTRRGVLADITCDSDGKIDRFIDRAEGKVDLELHPFTGEPYYLGAFLVGAYQEILGDLHNLFGDTNEILVSLDPDAGPGGYRIEEVVAGDSVTDVLRYVSYSRRDLMARVRRASEAALRARRMTLEESRHLLEMYEKGLAGYTYLERD